MKNINLVKKDYLSILKFYNIKPNNLSLIDIKQTAENILANKLCRCIKKVDNYYKKNKKKNDIIGICKNSVFTKKKLNFHKFKCKKNPRLISKTKKKHKIFKNI